VGLTRPVTPWNGLAVPDDRRTQGFLAGSTGEQTKGRPSR